MRIYLYIWRFPVCLPTVEGLVIASRESMHIYGPFVHHAPKPYEQRDLFSNENAVSGFLAIVVVFSLLVSLIWVYFRDTEIPKTIGIHMPQEFASSWPKTIGIHRVFGHHEANFCGI